ncbi:MAG: hypothetical protein JSW54_11535 [Fidelibacterota bacterium]|nr:MAG: hypothetical protein JSW54_11535 [Candidatus Neomarinimicrobiota bacterium]
MNRKSERYDILIFGNYTKDTIISASGTRHVDGGGFNYGAHAAVALGLRVAAVTQLAKEDFHVVRNLERAGVDVYAKATATSTRLKLEYPTSNVDDRILTSTAFAGSYSLDQFAGLEAQAILINGSVREEVPLEVVRGLSARDAFLVADVQGFVRVIAPDGQWVNEEWPEMEQVLSMLDVLKTDAVEAAFLTGETDIQKAARALAEFGPKEIVLTHRNGILVYAEGRFHEASFYPKELVGRSGRGDTCIASYMAKRLTLPAGEAIIWSAAVTSLKMEAEGPYMGDEAAVRSLIDSRYRA